MIRRPAIFLDRDGTINRDSGYTHRPEDLLFEDGALEGLKLLSLLPYALIITTNQSGISRGYFSQETFNTFMKHMDSKLREGGVVIDALYFCPHAPNACRCRKPATGMIEQAIQDFAVKGVELDLSRSIVIGDKTADGKFANQAGCLSILVETGHKGLDGEYECSWTYRAKHLKQAAEWIQAKTFGHL